jgi:ankyrin repeat protein
MSSNNINIIIDNQNEQNIPIQLIGPSGPIDIIGNIQSIGANGPNSNISGNVNGNVDGNISNVAIQSNNNSNEETYIDNQDDLLHIFYNALNNDNLEEAINIALIFPYEHEGIMRAIITKKNLEYVQLFIGLGYKIPLWMDSYDTISYVIMHCCDLLPVIIEHLDYENDYTLEGRNKNIMKICKELGDHIDIFNILLKYSHELNYKDEANNTFLIWAAAKGNLRIVQKLVELNVELNSTTTENLNALDYAFVRKNFDVAEYLLGLGCKLTINENTLRFADTNYDQEFILKCIDRQELTSHDVRHIFERELSVVQEKIITLNKYPNVIFQIVNLDNRDKLLEMLADINYDFNALDENKNNILAYILKSPHQVVEQLYSIKPYLDKIDINHQNEDGNTALMMFINFEYLHREMYTQEVLRHIKFDIFIRNKEGYTIIDKLIMKDEIQDVCEILFENNFRLIDYIKSVKSEVFIELIKNSKIFEYVSIEPSLDIRKYLDKNIKDINLLCELGLLKNQLTQKDIIEYYNNLDMMKLDKCPLLLKTIFEIQDNLSLIDMNIKLFELILFKKAYLLEMFDYKKVIKDYYKYTNYTVLTFLVNNCANETATILILKKIFTQYEIIEQNKLQNVFSKLIDIKANKMINFLLELNCEITLEQKQKIIENLNLEKYSETALKIIFTNITDNKLLLKFLLNDNKYEKLILDTATKKELHDNCIICYGKESDREFYYQCEHKHNYHFDCLIPYLKKHKMIDMTCFFCKGNMNFGNIYKN